MRSALGVGFLSSAVLIGCASTAPRVGTMDMGNARIHYLVAGRGPAVVLIHGWALDLRYWEDQIAVLAPHYRVVALDRRGYGQSTGYADPSADPGDVAALLDTLGIWSAVLVGHSGGADVAIRFAAKLPERVDALVLYGGGIPDGYPVPLAPGPMQGANMRRIARQFGLDSMFRWISSLPMFQQSAHRTPAMLARLDSIQRDYSGKDLLEDHPRSGAYPRAQFATMRQWKFPVLFISGVNERPRWIAFADSMVKWMPDARKVLVPGGAHGVSADEPALFNAALLAFLNGLSGGAPDQPTNGGGS